MPDQLNGEKLSCLNLIWSCNFTFVINSHAIMLVASSPDYLSFIMFQVFTFVANLVLYSQLPATKLFTEVTQCLFGFEFLIQMPFFQRIYPWTRQII